MVLYKTEVLAIRILQLKSLNLIQAGKTNIKVKSQVKYLYLILDN